MTRWETLAMPHRTRGDRPVLARTDRRGVGGAGRALVSAEVRVNKR